MPAPHTDAIAWGPDGSVRVLDQTALPAEVRWLTITSVEAMIEAIRSLRVRGAPLIGIAAAMGLAAEAARLVAEARAPQPSPHNWPTGEWLEAACRRLAAARPTAVNLRHAIERMQRAGLEAMRSGAAGPDLAQRLRTEAQAIWDGDAAMCQAIGEYGQALIGPGARILTHCNTGMLATGGIGTALGVVYLAHQRGRAVSVIATETRPLGQGARLTAWELTRAGIPCRVIVDGAAAWMMARREVDVVIVGADRIAANGDVANKIGTYGLALLARAHGIPFYVAAPRSTFDLASPSGEAIPIEERPASEIAGGLEGLSAFNPAFDVTPGALVTAIVTDQGVLRPPYGPSIAALGR
jgi:methylthioribose-1-phosphate isomerase